jgi:hypothetical protein
LQEERRKSTAKSLKMVRERFSERVFWQISRVVAFGKCLQGRGFVADDDRFFIPGPAIDIIFEDDRPIGRSFGFTPMKVRVLPPQHTMAKDAFNDVRLTDEAE